MLIEALNNMVVDGLMNRILDAICNEEKVKLHKSILISKIMEVDFRMMK